MSLDRGSIYKLNAALLGLPTRFFLNDIKHADSNVYMELKINVANTID